MTQIDLIGVGAPVVDSVAQVPEEFLATVSGAKGGMELIDSLTMSALLAKLPAPPVETPGGSAGNTIQCAAQLGLRTSFLGKLGNDNAANFFRENFRKAGVDISRFKTAALPNARCLSLVTPDSQRTMRTDLAASLTLSPADVTVSDFAACRHAHFEGYLLFTRELARHLLRCAKQAGCTISLDLGAHEVVTANRELLPGLLREYATLLVANEDEAAVLTGLDKNDPGQTALTLSKLTPIAVLNLGKQGSLIAADGALHRIPANPVENPADTTGAGDSWLAGFLHGWLNGKPLTLSGRHGAILGAEVVRQIGAQIPNNRWEAVKQKIAALE
ncbi:MAG: adenosine kinase [Verrucomicrobiales bacterium]|jgi:sugar/nucleoside kinase (ribokinase family)|nr:adenosine kinase [Verrucomicrobiales bacterium]